MVNGTKQSLGRLQLKPRQTIFPEGVRVRGEDQTAPGSGHAQRLPQKLVPRNPERADPILNANHDVERAVAERHVKRVHKHEFAWRVRSSECSSQGQALFCNVDPDNAPGTFGETDRYAALATSEFENGIVRPDPLKHV
jgi:hypothetical protein